jgi:phosphohistidine swiveling domain-containing protein
MTTPDLVIAMERASAIITDEGGIACHAAIVSRELGIPCIIGTRYASKVLRDYDAVSVDAFVGRVRKIKWAKVVRRSSGLMWKARSLLGHTKRVFQATLDMQGFDFLRSVDHQTWAADDELQQFRASLGKRIAEGKSYFREMYAKCTSSAQRLLAAASKLNDPIQLRNLSANALADLFDSYNEEYLRVVPFRALINILAEKLVAVLKEHLDKALPNPHSEAEIEELLQILIVPSQENLYVDEMRAFLHLCEQAISNPKIHEIFESDSDGIAVASAIARVAPRFEELLSEHIAEYGWVATARSSVAEWTKHDLLTRMKAIPISCAASKLQEIQQRRVQGLREKQRLISKYALGEQILKLLDIAGDYAFLRQYRIDIFFIADFKARYLEREISRRLNLDPGLFSSLTPMEVLSALRGQTLPSSDELVQRKHAYALYAIGGDLRVIPHKDIPLLVQRPQIENEVNSVKGSVAHRGVVVGRACVVMSRHDLGKCKGGDVIISPMTTPELVEALERAAAIVTDEGGALCHAAVISRELGIPCVVGTVNATELFRDGQLLKVDASQSQGTVEIVS